MSKRKRTAAEQWRTLPSEVRRLVVDTIGLDLIESDWRDTPLQDWATAKRVLGIAVRVLREAARRPRRA